MGPAPCGLKRYEPVPFDSEDDRRATPAEGMSDQVLEIRAALAALDLESRVLLLLIDQQGHSYQEAAGILGLSEGAVTSRIHRARKAFLEVYGKA